MKVVAKESSTFKWILEFTVNIISPLEITNLKSNHYF